MKTKLFAGMPLKSLIALILVIVSFAALLLPWIEISIDLGGITYDLDTLVQMACTYENTSRAQFDLEMQAAITEMISDLSEAGIVLNTKKTLKLVNTLISGKLSLVDLANLLLYGNDVISAMDRAIKTSGTMGVNLAVFSSISDAKIPMLIGSSVFLILLAAALILFLLALNSFRTRNEKGIIPFCALTAVIFLAIFFIVFKANDILITYTGLMMSTLNDMLSSVGLYNYSLQTIELFHLTGWPWLSLICAVAALVVSLSRINFKSTNINLNGLGKWMCPNCGSQVNIGNLYCTVCGTKKPEKPRCECGAELRDGVAFCGKCGRKVEARIEVNIPSNPQYAEPPRYQNSFQPQNSSQSNPFQQQSNPFQQPQNPFRQHSAPQYQNPGQSAPGFQSGNESGFNAPADNDFS